jgi:hypothetical protein
MREAIRRAREDRQPILVEAITYRFRGHSMADPEEYRTKEQVEEWRKRDPINTFAERLLREGVLEQGEPEKLVLRALELEPQNQKALALAGTAAFETFTTSRIQAGAPINGDVFKCATKPLSAALTDGSDTASRILDDAPRRLVATGDAEVADIRTMVERFSDEERELSTRRRELFRRNDAVRDELAARYKDGRADVRKLLGDG